MTAYPQFWDSAAAFQIETETENDVGAGSTLAAQDFWIYNDKGEELGATVMADRAVFIEAWNGRSWVRSGLAILNQQWVEVAITGTVDDAADETMEAQIAAFTALGAGDSLLVSDIPPGCGREISVRVVVPLGASEGTPRWQLIFDEIEEGS